MYIIIFSLFQFSFLNVLYQVYMFYGAATFNQDLSSWDVSSGTSFVSSVLLPQTVNELLFTINLEHLLLIHHIKLSFLIFLCIGWHVQRSKCIQPRLEQLGCIQGYYLCEYDDDCNKQHTSSNTNFIFMINQQRMLLMYIVFSLF